MQSITTYAKYAIVSSPDGHLVLKDGVELRRTDAHGETIRRFKTRNGARKAIARDRGRTRH